MDTSYFELIYYYAELSSHNLIIITNTHKLPKWVKTSIRRHVSAENFIFLYPFICHCPLGISKERRSFCISFPGNSEISSRHELASDIIQFSTISGLIISFNTNVVAFRNLYIFVQLCFFVQYFP